MNIQTLALSQAGIKEIVGGQHNPKILKYFDDIGFDGNKLGDETSWCSAFINWLAFRLGLEMSGKLNARSWLNVGEVIEDGCQQVGDIAIFWRDSKNGWKGHVGVYCNDLNNGWISILGGNQNNQVKLSNYPKSRLLGYRRLRQGAII